MLTKITTLFFIQDGPKHMCWQKLKILILTQKRVFVNFEGTVLPSSLIHCNAFGCPESVICDSHFILDKNNCNTFTFQSVDIYLWYLFCILTFIHGVKKSTYPISSWFLRHSWILANLRNWLEIAMRYDRSIIWITLLIFIHIVIDIGWHK